MRQTRTRRAIFLAAAFLPAAALFSGSGNIRYRFDFGPGEAGKGRIRVPATGVYSGQTGYGFDLRSSPNWARDRKGTFCTGEKPFFFSVKVPEGNYNVSVVVGDAGGEASVTIRAESRRLMIERAQTRAGEFKTLRFTVNVRDSLIRPEGAVRLKSRERNSLNWDDKLTLEFNGQRPCIRSVEIARTDDAVTVYLAGNSTVVDQAQEPWAAWGQMIPRFFKPGKVAVANHAESGESLISFAAERRLEKIWSTIRPGDYLFVEFAHNDQKPGPAYAEAFTTYQDRLREIIRGAHERKAVPVLVTSMHRRNFDAEGKIVNTLGDYPEAMRRTARETGAALIDLNAMSGVFYEALGPGNSVRAFVHYPAGTFPGQERELKDNTHFNAYGAYELAKCIVEGIRAGRLDLAKFIAKGVPAFDPSRPDPVEDWSLPPSPQPSTAKPDGS
jgi:lysophospholipase L1-like esterase